MDEAAEIELFLARLAIASAAGLLLAAGAWFLARRRGRDTVGWSLAVLFPAVPGLLAALLATPSRPAWFFGGLGSALVLPLLLVALPAIETAGQTRRCPGCGRILPWRALDCPSCGASLPPPRREEGAGRVNRPLRRFFFWLFLVIFLLLIVFGLIGYFCVPSGSAAAAWVGPSVPEPRGWVEAGPSPLSWEGGGDGPHRPGLVGRGEPGGRTMR